MVGIHISKILPKVTPNNGKNRSINQSKFRTPSIGVQSLTGICYDGFMKGGNNFKIINNNPTFGFYVINLLEF